MGIFIINKKEDIGRGNNILKRKVSLSYSADFRKQKTELTLLILFK